MKNGLLHRWLILSLVLCCQTSLLVADDEVEVEALIRALLAEGGQPPRVAAAAHEDDHDDDDLHDHGLKFLTAGGGGLTSDAVRCIDYARNNGARIISNSWGGKGPIPKVLEQAIQRAQAEGILFVVAAGNDGKNIDFNKE